jgi:hypothetical protein
MSKQNSPLEDSDEIIIHPESQRSDENVSHEDIPIQQSVSSAPSNSENINELLLKAVEILNRDMADLKQNIGHELFQIR